MKKIAIAAAMCTGVLLAGTAAVQVKAGPDLVKFPSDYEKAVKYGVVSNPANKLYRELYTTADAIAAVKAGKPVPSGTWVLMKSYKSKQDASGAPLKGADGHFVKDELAAYAVMEKRTGWGKEYPDNIRNGEWEYQAYTAAKSVNAGAKLQACFECHKPKDSDDFLFSIGMMRSHK